MLSYSGPVDTGVKLPDGAGAYCTCATNLWWWPRLSEVFWGLRGGHSENGALGLSG